MTPPGSLFRAFAPIVVLVLLTCVGCGNNIGRLFDPDVGSGSGADASSVAVAPVGGFSVEGRPALVDAFPKGGGWHTSTPVVVVFNESVNQNSVAPSAASEPETVFIRVQGTEAALPATYDFLLGGTVVVIRPTGGINAPEGASLEVVISPEMRDADGVRYGGSEPEVAAVFTADAESTDVDGRIVTTLPLDNAENRIRETPVYAILSRPAVESSVTTSNFRVQTSAAVVSGAVSFPIDVVPNTKDTRILRFDPSSNFAGGVQHQIVFDATITFEDSGVLDFRNRSPYARFTTQFVPAPTSVAVGNPTTGFDDKINRSNLANLLINVELAADARAGDRVGVRLYGLDSDPNAATNDVVFFERFADVPMDGVQTVAVNFGAVLGTTAAPEFLDGAISMRAFTTRGSRRSGYVRSSTSNSPAIDLTQPTITALGPPTSATTATDVLMDQEYLALYGTASEEIGAASITVGSNTLGLWASTDDGRFSLLPVQVGVLAGSGGTYSLSLTDAAGNMVAAAQTGAIQQRGVVAGGALAGTLVIEAYDQTTLLPIAGATVIIEPGAPTKPATGQLVSTTAANGRATFTGLGGSSYTATIVATGYDLVTLYDSPAAFASLPLRPVTGSTASLAATLTPTGPTTGRKAAFGTNVFADRHVELIETATATPTAVPATAVLPNRPVFANAFLGVFPATALSTFSDFACGLCGANSLTFTPPIAPIAAGGSESTTLTLLDSGGAIQNVGTYNVDFASATGLGAISGTPTVRFMLSLRGFPGTTLCGVGFSALASGTTYAIQGTYALRIPQLTINYNPVLWSSVEAADAAGNVSRQRVIVADLLNGTATTVAAPPGVPTVTAPGGPITGSPSVTYADRLNPSGTPGGFGIADIRATDAAGRRWTVLRNDQDAATGAAAIQFPDLSGVSVTGLATGGWVVQVEEYLFFTPTFNATSYVLEERFRHLVTYARTATVAFTIQ